MPENNTPVMSDEERYLELDLLRGEVCYSEAMQAILGKVKLSYGSKADPRKIANLLITEMYQYLDGILPGIDLRESAALFGAVMGVGLAGHLTNGTITEAVIPELVEAFTSSFINTVPSAVELVTEAQKKAEGIIIDPNKPGSAVSRPAKQRRRK